MKTLKICDINDIKIINITNLTFIFFLRTSNQILNNLRNYNNNSAIQTKVGGFPRAKKKEICDQFKKIAFKTNSFCYNNRVIITITIGV